MGSEFLLRKLRRAEAKVEQLGKPTDMQAARIDLCRWFDDYVQANPVTPQQAGAFRTMKCVLLSGLAAYDYRSDERTNDDRSTGED